MTEEDDTRSRRRFLKAGLIGTLVGNSGCLRFVGGGDETPMETDVRTATGTATPPTGPGNAEFSFSFRAEDQQVIIRYNGGTEVRAENLQVQTTAGTQAMWAELGSTQAQPSATLQDGATAVLGEEILNWGEAIGREETIRLVYTGGETPITLGRFTPPGTATPSTTIPPTETTGQSQGENIFDDFEDQEIGWEITGGDHSVLTLSSESKHGEQSLHFREAENNENSAIVKDVSNATKPTSASFWFKYESSNDNQFNLKLIDSNGNHIVSIREYFQAVHYNFRNSPPEHVASISQQDWYRVTLQNIDFDNQNLDIVVANSDEDIVNQASNVAFRDEATDFQRVRITNGLSNNGGADPLWIDYIKYEI